MTCTFQEKILKIQCFTLFNLTIWFTVWWSRTTQCLEFIHCFIPKHVHVNELKLSDWCDVLSSISYYFFFQLIIHVNVKCQMDGFHWKSKWNKKKMTEFSSKIESSSKWKFNMKLMESNAKRTRNIKPFLSLRRHDFQITQRF